MESNEQTELISKTETDSDREQADSSVGKGGGRGVKQRRKRTPGHGQQGGDCRVGAWVEVEKSIKGINGNRKNTIKIKYF